MRSLPFRSATVAAIVALILALDGSAQMTCSERLQVCHGYCVKSMGSAGLIAGELKVTPLAAQDLVAELDLRKMTGRGRYRAWGIL